MWIKRACLIALMLGCVWFPGETLVAGEMGGDNEIGYIRPEIPKVKISAWKGERYEDTVPGTIDIAESARLAINALTGALDPTMDDELYFSVNFRDNPPKMSHSFDDWCQPKFMESLPLMRLMTGSEQNGQVDQVWKDVILKSLGPDGLYYNPIKGRPWAKVGNVWTGIRVWRADGTGVPFKDPSVTQFAAPWQTMRILSAMTVYYLRDHNPLWRKACEKMIDRLLEASVKRGDAAYFGRDFLAPGARLPRDLPPGIGHKPLEYNSRIMHDCAHFFRVTGYENARVLGKMCANYVRELSQYFGPNGEWLIDRYDPKEFPDARSTSTAAVTATRSTT